MAAPEPDKQQKPLRKRSGQFCNKNQKGDFMCCSQERCPFMGVKECGIDGPKCEYFTPFMPLRKVKVISPEGIIQTGQMDQYQNIYGIGIPSEHLAHEGYQVEGM